MFDAEFRELFTTTTISAHVPTHWMGVPSRRGSRMRCARLQRPSSSQARPGGHHPSSGLHDDVGAVGNLGSGKHLAKHQRRTCFRHIYRSTNSM